MPRKNQNNSENGGNAKSYSVSLYPNEAEKIDELGLSRTEVTRFGLEVLLKQRRIARDKIPIYSILIGIGAIILLLALAVAATQFTPLVTYPIIVLSLIFIAYGAYRLLMIAYLNGLASRRLRKEAKKEGGNS